MRKKKRKNFTVKEVLEMAYKGRAQWRVQAAKLLGISINRQKSQRWKLLYDRARWIKRNNVRRKWLKFKDPEVRDNYLTGIAREMKRAGLYSQTTALCDIVRTWEMRFKEARG